MTAVASFAILVYFVARPRVETYVSIRAANATHNIPEGLHSLPHRGPVFVSYCMLNQDLVITGNCEYRRLKKWIGPASDGATFLVHPSNDYLARMYGQTPKVETMHSEFKLDGKNISIYAQPNGKFAVNVYADKDR